MAFDDKLRSRNRILFSGKRKFLNGQSLYNNYLRIRLKVVLCLQSYCVGRKFCWYFLFNKHSYVTPTQEYCNARTQTHTNAHIISNPRTLSRTRHHTHTQSGWYVYTDVNNVRRKLHVCFLIISYNISVILKAPKGFNRKK